MKKPEAGGFRRENYENIKVIKMRKSTNIPGKPERGIFPGFHVSSFKSYLTRTIFLTAV